MASDSALAALTGRPVVPPVRVLASRWLLTVAGVRWLERGTLGRAGTRAGSEAAVTTCGRRLVSMWCVRATRRRWCTALSWAAWRVELIAAAVGCTEAARATCDACAAGAALTTGSSRHTVDALAAEATPKAPASTTEAIKIRVGQLTL